MQFFRDEDFSWRILAIESIVIMLSVLLAFVLTGWRESSEQQKTVEKALKSITIEIQYNQSRMERVLPYYKQMADTLNELLKEKGGNTPFSMVRNPDFPGVKFLSLQNSAWQTLKSTGVLTEMKFEVANQLSAIYRKQKGYTFILESLTKALIMGELNTLKDWWMAYGVLTDNSEFAPNLYPDMLRLLKEEYDIAYNSVEPSDSTDTASDAVGSLKADSVHSLKDSTAGDLQT